MYSKMSYQKFPISFEDLSQSMHIDVPGFLHNAMKRFKLSGSLSDIDPYLLFFISYEPVGTKPKIPNIIQQYLFLKYGEVDHERFEFIGDRIFDLIVSNILFENKAFSSADLTQNKSLFVNNITMACYGEKIGMYIIPKFKPLFGHPDNKKLKKDHYKPYADKVEGLIGIVYIHLLNKKGIDVLEEMKKWLNNLFGLEHIIKAAIWGNGSLYPTIRCIHLSSIKRKSYPPISEEESKQRLTQIQQYIDVPSFPDIQGNRSPMVPLRSMDPSKPIIRPPTVRSSLENHSQQRIEDSRTPLTATSAAGSSPQNDSRLISRVDESLSGNQLPSLIRNYHQAGGFSILPSADVTLGAYDLYDDNLHDEDLHDEDLYDNDSYDEDLYDNNPYDDDEDNM